MGQKLFLLLRKQFYIKLISIQSFPPESMEHSFTYKLIMGFLVYLSFYENSGNALSVDILIEKANIYYQQP